MIIASNTKYNASNSWQEEHGIHPYFVCFFSVEGTAVSHSSFKSRLASNGLSVSRNLVSLSSFHLGNILLLDRESAIGYSFRAALEAVPISFGLPGLRQELCRHLSWFPPKSNAPSLHLLSGYLPCLRLSEVSLWCISWWISLSLFSLEFTQRLGLSVSYLSMHWAGFQARFPWLLFTLPCVLSFWHSAANALGIVLSPWERSFSPILFGWAKFYCSVLNFTDYSL